MPGVPTVLFDTSELTAAFRAAAQKGPLHAQMAKALVGEAGKVMAKSLAVVPRDTEALARSAAVDPPVTTGNQVTVGFGYGDEEAHYAIPVHERLDVKHDPPTMAKYLEIPLIQATGGIRRRLGRGVIRYLEGRWRLTRARTTGSGKSIIGGAFGRSPSSKLTTSLTPGPNIQGTQGARAAFPTQANQRFRGTGRQFPFIPKP